MRTPVAVVIITHLQGMSQPLYPVRVRIQSEPRFPSSPASETLRHLQQSVAVMRVAQQYRAQEGYNSNLQYEKECLLSRVSGFVPI